MTLVKKELNINVREEIIKELKKLSLTEQQVERLKLEFAAMTENVFYTIYLLKLVADYARENNEPLFCFGTIYNVLICYLLISIR